MRDSKIDAVIYESSWLMASIIKNLDHEAANRDGILQPKSLRCLHECENPRALSLTEPVPRAFDFPASDWPKFIGLQIFRL